MTLFSSRTLAGGLLLGATGVLVAAALILSPGERSDLGGRERGRSDLAAAAAQLASRLDQGIYERSRDVQLAAQNDVLADPGASVDAKRSFLARWHALRPEYAIAVFASPEGRILATSNRLLEGADVSSREWFVKGRAGPAVVDVHDALLLGKLLRTEAGDPPRFIDLVAPVYGRDGDLRGVVAVHLFAAWVGEVEHASRATLGREAAQITFSVATSAGEVLTGSRGLREQRFGALGPAATHPDPTTVSTIAAGYREYPGLGWRVTAQAGAGFAGEGASAAGGVLAPAVGLGLPLAVMLWSAGGLVARRARADAAEEGATSGPATSRATPANDPEPWLDEPLPGAVPNRVEAGEAPAVPPGPGVVTQPAAQDVPGEAADRRKVDALRQLTDGTAHDFSNLDVLRRREALDGEGRRLVDAALRGAERGTTLTQRMLTLPRSQPAHAARTDLRELVDGMCNLIGRCGLPGIDLRVDIPEGLGAAVVDAKQLEVAILNLVVNAQDAMQAGGTLTITAANVVHAGDGSLATGRYLRLAVIDEGHGMDAATLARAAEPFFSTRGAGKRAGLGLSVVQSLMAKAGGALRLESQPGAGTRAELWLPATQVRTAPAGRPGLRTLALDILLVDDDALVRASTAEMLEDLGHRVVEAGSGVEALAILGSAAAVDVVITDDAMPGMTGGELARAVSAMRPRTRIVVASGYAPCRDGVPDALPRLTKPLRQAEVSALLAALFEAGSSRPVEEGKVLPFRRA